MFLGIIFWHNSDMSWVKKIILEIYVVLFALFVGQQAVDFFSPYSAIHLYFRILIAFDLSFFFQYFLNLVQILLNILHLFPLIFFIHHKNYSPSRFWQCLLILRIIFDVTGHPYAVTQLISLYRDDPQLSAIVLLSYLSFCLPSYVACYRFAFRRNP